MREAPAKANAKARLLDAALTLICGKGHEAATVDELRAAAGVTKGAFILAKATDSAEVAAHSIDQFGRHIAIIFAGAKEEALPC